MYLRSPHVPIGRWRRLSAALFFLCALLLVLCSCGGGGSGNLILVHGQSSLAQDQSMSLPLIGTTDVPSLDPTGSLDQSGKLLMSMFYSGLVRQDKNFQIQPDQASWEISNSGKTYTFHLNAGVTFADGSPVTAQSYVDSWNRALNLAAAAKPTDIQTASEVTPSPSALALPISGAQEVLSGRAHTLSGVQTVDDRTLRVTLTRPTPTFLQALAQPFFFPVNDRLVDVYGQQNWPVTVAKEGIGTGPFVIKEWDRDEKMILVPSTHYYGPKLTLTQLTVYFMNDPRVSYTVNRQSGRFDLTYDMVANDQLAARGLHGYTSTTALQTDALFFDTTQAPFNSKDMREAFALALDKQTLAHVALNDTVVSAETLYPPAMPGYQANSSNGTGAINKVTNEPVTFDVARARQLLKAASNTHTAITFSYPQSQLKPDVASAMQSMWWQNLGIRVTMRPLEDNDYAHEMSMHALQFGLYSWSALSNDPADFADRLLSNSPQNIGRWQNTSYDQTVAQAEATSGNARLQLYHQAEQIALNDVAIVPLSHEVLTALIAVYLQGISLNANGLYVGDWSQVKVLSHYS